ncbi:hypothetical protein HETIRDRAFT_103464 [Heterobasidion irregulare TC 32-1]|uniref:F-box domain-containing protein n=1 Tax=Heterobasidion irregulare (strain TC 32-1) TaxID=747525 RepID=W4K2N9_HETIT|nr:uncharacterized protein HETIRDRAFT_103464 [Heterobasidion irregulare TC 32-1]ETW79999.1 hypothetical protein HETIRDRAFT_103464 [Heterobasidion irregulare TC 32-1]
MSDKPTVVPKDALDPSKPDHWTVSMGARLKTLNAFINSVAVTSPTTSPLQVLEVLDVEIFNLNSLVADALNPEAPDCWAEIARPKFSTLDAIINDLHNGNRQKARQIVEAELLNLCCVLSAFRSHDSTHFPEDRVRCIINISCVCHRWREAALDYAYLRGTVTSPAPGEERPAEMLRRAKEAPLMVSCGFFVEPAPILESLSLTFKQALRVPQNLFALHAPSLRILQFSGLTISWASPILMNLTMLDPRLPQELREQQFIPLTLRVFDGLERMPGLEVLCIHDCFLHFPRRGSIDEHTRPNPIELPHLSEIELQGSSQACVVITRSIQILPTTVLKLSLDANENTDGFAALYPVIGTVSGNSDNEKPWRGLSVSAWLSLDIKTWKSSRSAQQAQHPEGDVYIHINYKFRHTQDLDPLCTIYRALCRSDLSTLSINYPCDDLRGFALARYWLPLQCQQLQHILLHDGIWASCLIDALRPIETSSGDHTRRTTAVPFPCLRSLDLIYYYKNDL